MDYRSTPDPSSLPQAEYFPESFRRNGTEGNLTTPGSSSRPPDPYTPFHGKPIIIEVCSSRDVQVQDPSTSPSHIPS